MHENDFANKGQMFQSDVDVLVRRLEHSQNMQCYDHRHEKKMYQRIHD